MLYKYIEQNIEVEKSVKLIHKNVNFKWITQRARKEEGNTFACIKSMER